MINIARLKKAEIVWMCNHRCRHGNRYIEHTHCYEVEKPDQQRVGFIDIEASNLTADWGVTLCVSILNLHDETNWVRTITKKEIFSDGFDKALLKDVVDKMRQYDRLIGFYCSDRRFDIPFLRTRAVKWGVDFPVYSEIMCEDLWPIVRNKFKLTSNRLANASEVLMGASEKTKWLYKHWVRAIQGNKVSLAYIEDHCLRDTVETKKLYLLIHKYARSTNTSI